MALNSKRRILALTGVLAVALTATACGSSDDGDSGDTASSGGGGTIDLFGVGMLNPHSADACVGIGPMVPLAVHDHPPVRQLLHRPDGQPAAPLEEAALVVGQDRPVIERVIDDATREHEVVGSSDDHQWVELEVLQRPHRERRAFEATPAPARPQAASAHDVSPGRDTRDLEHRLLLDPVDRMVRAERLR